MSNKDRFSIFPESFRRSDMDCPMPPAAPTTVTFMHVQKDNEQSGTRTMSTEEKFSASSS